MANQSTRERNMSVGASRSGVAPQRWLMESLDTERPEPLPANASAAVGHDAMSSELIPEDVRAELGLTELEESCADTPAQAFSIPDDVLAEQDAAARVRARVRGDDGSALALFE